ncbi:cysteine--1-D-myo-inosityl 2-amino-2-deoxy-alpha-D-glucopyranoside ligase [Jatrophihabitans endophyticus]|uniref:cysteine--1-D-myo-inosityl 2-amino-2-deoxy-alpha-D-glucopyranoside ligase n=1 Tax=Jatrophihabitans endophyticus TaxID=1206085 RepID=UPI0019FDBF3C|nr:cysteine--1-D-myo-inosityl 2-amino-2-deoxy-alpha-D-glucopyranoside ligase [Jatrophihabitans endophyticus]MBE7190465.1 cysteine--1-D-myo-inosityl 2-amino-2-deoxy-alpha-D-glucopyranoside ligase [Jatrophihabitans endophyticus]
MDGWPTTDVPELPGSGPRLSLYDTAQQAVRPTEPGDTARMYVCGITPYDATHLGHAATYLAFDLVQRVWRDAGHRVHYVQNVTDVDDPLLERAAHTGESWVGLAERETQLFREDMAALRVLPPDDYVGAVEAIPEITEAIAAMLEAGTAYRLDEDVYFPVDAAPGFGHESNYDRDTMLALFAERGGDPQRAGKRDPLDSVLWRGRRPSEPYWDTPLGPGRPGWHIECSVIALNRLGMRFDVQGGGSDLAFPHHEHSAAHAEALTGDEPFAQHYVHAGMIGLDGEKMSKSRGNLVLVSKLRAAGVDPMAIRLALLDGHYRDDREWTGGRLRAAEARLERWRAAVALPAAPPADELLTLVRDRLADDLDTPTALVAIDSWAASALDTADGVTDDAAPGLVADLVDALLGVDLR